MKQTPIARFIWIALSIALTVLPAYSAYRFSALHNWNNRTVKKLPLSYSLLHDPFYMETHIVSETFGTMRHVSSLTPLGKGRLMAVWYEGSDEGASDVTVNSAIYDEHTLRWATPAVVLTPEQSARELNKYIKKVGNALIYKDTSGRLWLFYVTISSGGWSTSSINYRISLDDGLTWGTSRQIITSPFINISTNIKNKPVELDDGSLLLPAYHEFIDKYSLLIRIMPLDERADRIAIDMRKMTHRGSAIQASLLYGGGKTLTAYMRNMDKGNMLVTESSDMGQTWSKLTKSILPNPNSGADMITRQDGSYLGVLNLSAMDRRNLNIVISTDKGKTWRIIKTIEDSADREYSYPFIAQTETGVYHLSYTFERKTIKHVSFNDDWLDLQLAESPQ